MPSCGACTNFCKYQLVNNLELSNNEENSQNKCTSIKITENNELYMEARDTCDR